jgi:UDP-N-acetylmuramate dehydrogenase
VVSRLQEQVALAPLSTIGVGGPARWFVTATSTGDVADAHRWCAERQLPLTVLGGGSNIVVADRGVQGLVLHVGIAGVREGRPSSDVRVSAGAGERWDSIVSLSVERGLAGLECLSGIPGFVGGTPIQNVGAYGQEVADTIESVVVYDRAADGLRTLTAAECAFAYRSSRFKHADAGRFIVCEVTFVLRSGPPQQAYPDVAAALAADGRGSPTLADVRHAVLAIRRHKGMVLDADDADSRSVGSFFVNPVLSMAHVERLASTAGSSPPRYPAAGGLVKVPAAWLIERAGFARGDGEGAVGISAKHTLAIVNRGGASAGDVVRFAAAVKRRVGERFDVWLRPEPVFLGFDDDDPTVAFLRDTPPA